MKHEERFELAQLLCARMVSEYPGDILLAGVYGSTAAGTDTPWSDVEMMFTVRNGSRIPGKRFIYRSIALGYRVIEHARLQELLTSPSLDLGYRWPFWMGLLSSLNVLYGEAGQVREWLALGRSAPVERFHEALEATLPGLVVEPYSRILSCRERHNAREIGCSALELLAGIGLSLCLLNQRWTTHGYYLGLIETLSFPRLPENYEASAIGLWSARDVTEIVALAQALIDSFWSFLRDEGIKVTNYQAVEELPL